MLATATKYTDVRAPAARTSPAAPLNPQLSTLNRPFIPKTFAVQMAKRTPKGEDIRSFMEREFRHGGLLREYLRREQALADKRRQAVAQRAHTLRPNAKSDWKLLAHVDARDFQRWKQKDRHFWMDDANLRSLKRDNPFYAHTIHV